MRKQLLIGLVFTAMVAYFGMHDSGMLKIIAVSNAAELAYAPQINDEREIKVTVTPRDLVQKAGTWDFEVVLETHTKTLSDDLANTSVLIADGKPYAPLNWKFLAQGGHHRKGTLRFNVISPQPSSVELHIRLSADPAPRSFKWLLK